MISSPIPERKTLELAYKTVNVPHMEKNAWSLALHTRPCLLLHIKNIIAIILYRVNSVSIKIISSSTHDTVSTTILQMTILRLVEVRQLT